MTVSIKKGTDQIWNFRYDMCDVVEVCSVHVSMSVSHAHRKSVYTFHSFLVLNSTHISEVPNLTTQ